MNDLDRLAAEPALTALLLDVDGVLAPIVERPEDARVPASTQAELRRLADRYGLVACVTGRPSAVAEEIVGVPELTIVGEHGLELEPEAERWAPLIRTFAESAPWPAEEKPLTAAFHYRGVEDPVAARAQLGEIASEALGHGFRVRWGRMVLEILPPLDVSKGTAVRRLLERSGLRRALYAGDDTTDLDGFDALDGLDLAVRVAISSADGPQDLAARADLVVGSPESFAELLRQL